MKEARAKATALAEERRATIKAQREATEKEEAAAQSAPDDYSNEVDKFWDQVDKWFEMLDKNKAGCLEKSDARPFLLAYLTSQGKQQDQSSIDAAFIDIDTNASGTINKFQMFDCIKAIGCL